MGALAEDFETVGHARECLVVDRTVGLDDVFFFVAIAGMHEVVGEATVVGEEDETCRVLVEATYREDTLGYIHDVEDGFFAVLTARRDDVAGLVEGIVDEGCIRAREVATVDDGVDGGIDDLTDSRRLTIHGHPAATDRLLGIAARAETCLAEVFMDAERSRRMGRHRVGEG